MALFRFHFRLSKAKDSVPSPQGYAVRLLLRDESGDPTELARKDLDKPSFSGSLPVTTSAAKLRGLDAYLEIKRRNSVGGAVRSPYFRLDPPPAAATHDIQLESYKLLDQEVKVNGQIEIAPASDIASLGLDVLAVRLETRSGLLTEDPVWMNVDADGSFAFSGTRMVLNPGKKVEDILRVFTQAGIDVGRHFSESQPGVVKTVGIRVGQPFLDVWGEFRSRHPQLAARLEQFDFDPKRAHKGDDLFWGFRRYRRERNYQIAEGLTVKAKKGPAGDPDWVWNIKLDNYYDSNEGFVLPNDKNRTKHNGLHVEACKSLSRELLPDGLTATAETVPAGKRVWMLGSYVFDDTRDFGTPDHEHFELHPLYVIEPSMGGWFHFAVFESIALAKEVKKAGSPDIGDGWPRDSENAQDYRDAYGRPELLHRSDPQHWRSSLAATYGIIYEHYKQDIAGLTRFFAQTSMRYDSLGLASGLPGEPAEKDYRDWAKARIDPDPARDRRNQILDGLIDRLMSQYRFLFGPASAALEPVHGPAPQSILRCVYAREQLWASTASKGALGEPNPRIGLNRATSNRTEDVRRELGRLYRDVLAGEPDPNRRGELFAEVILAYRQWAVPASDNVDQLDAAGLHAYGSSKTPATLTKQIRACVDRFWDELTPYRRV